MSETSGGAGWWQASDGRWYPPQGQAPPPPPQQPKKGGCLKVGLILLAIFVVLGIIGIVFAAIAANKVADEVGKNLEAATPEPVDPSNPDAQKEDQNAAIGESVKLSGYTTAVTAASFRGEISEFEDEGYLVADVSISNRDDKAQPYNYFDFKLQTPTGQVLDPTFATIDGLLQSGDLIKGGSVAGKIVWEVGAAKGDFFIIYKPDPFDAARGLWKVTL